MQLHDASYFFAKVDPAAGILWLSGAKNRLFYMTNAISRPLSRPLEQFWLEIHAYSLRRRYWGRMG
jgi:hypothetical protein